MIRCQVCGKELSSGWICGVPPAEEKLKLGLCPDHDTPANREKVLAKWEEMIKSEVKASSSLAGKKLKKSGPSGYEIEIFFLDGGVKTVTAASYDLSDEKDLLVLNCEGGYDFYPLRHVRRFRIREKPGQ